MCLAPLDEVKNEKTQGEDCFYCNHYHQKMLSDISLAASRLSVYRVPNVSRPVQQIQIAPFLAFTLPHLPLTLGFTGWIPL